MNDTVVLTKHLTKKYKNYTALDDVSITLESGRIYGLIGKNGAGKTTLMRILCGLACPTKGSIQLFGKENPVKIQQERKRMGCIIEEPGLIPTMTGKENLNYHRILRGIPDTSSIDIVLKRVGLSDSKNRKVKDYSLGMRQRLGIAIALLGNPELLILDEPINGLDPVGVVEIRRLICELSQEYHLTILISSHNLPELYHTATDYIILHEGRIKKELSMEELDNQCRHHIRMKCDDVERMTTVMEHQLNTTNYIVLPDHTVKLYDYIDESDYVAKTLFQEGICLLHFSTQGDTLENYFLSLIDEKVERSNQ